MVLDRGDIQRGAVSWYVQILTLVPWTTILISVSQSSYPELVKAIVRILRLLREAGIPVSVQTARGIMLGYIEHDAPELLSATAKDGSRFRCTDAFVRAFLYEHLRWVPRRSTRAAQKTPEDAKEQIWQLFLRMALVIRDAGIRHPDLVINFDQTQVVVADNSARTLDVEGSTQVSVTSKEEKRAWTAVMGVSAAGHVLPTQVIMKGSTDRSLPSRTSPLYDEAIKSGMVFSFNPKNHWSSLVLMEVYFERIIVPFLVQRKKDLGYDDDQECIVLLDCWSLHRGREFRQLVRTRWPWIRLRYIPGGTTGLAQPCDVGIQRPYKLSIKRSQLLDVTNETLKHLDNGETPDHLKLDTTIGTLRNRSVAWFVKARKDIDHPDLVKKVCLPA